MLASQRFVRHVVFAGLILSFTATAVAQSLLLGPALQTSPVEPGTSTAPLSDKRTQNAEQLRLAQRKVATNGASDKAAAQEVAYRQARDAVLAQQEAVEQQAKNLGLRKAKLETQLKSPSAPDKAPTFADLDRLKDDLAAEQARAALAADKLATAKANRDKAQSGAR